MSTQELIAAALTAADELSNQGVAMFDRIAEDIREACARAMMPIEPPDEWTNEFRWALSQKGLKLELTKAAEDALAERSRQVEAEGWTPEHDDAHSDGSLAVAAACYALSSTGWLKKSLWRLWPKTWSASWLKPKSRREDLVRAAALILAEIERLDRKPCKHTNMIVETGDWDWDWEVCLDCGKRWRR